MGRLGAQTRRGGGARRKRLRHPRHLPQRESRDPGAVVPRRRSRSPHLRFLSFAVFYPRRCKMKTYCLAICVVLCACGQGTGLADRRTHATDVVVSNGEQLNGEQLNGVKVNGPGMAVDVEYAVFAGASVDG